MSGHLVTKYVNLTDIIAVPEEWPAHVFQEFLVPLIEQVINAVNSGKSVVLQVFNTPAKLVQRQDRNGIQYFFEKVFREELIDSHVIDVVFDMNDKNMGAMKGGTGRESFDPNTLEYRVSLDDYNVQVYRSELRTTFYLMPIAQSTTTSRSVQIQQHDSSQRKTLTKRETNRDITLFLIVVIILPLLFLIVLMETYVN